MMSGVRRSKVALSSTFRIASLSALSEIESLSPNPSKLAKFVSSARICSRNSTSRRMASETQSMAAMAPPIASMSFAVDSPLPGASASRTVCSAAIAAPSHHHWGIFQKVSHADNRKRRTVSAPRDGVRDLGRKVILIRR